MQVLVTGSEGFIGRVVVGALRSRGHHVRGLDLQDSGSGCDDFIQGSLADREVAAAAVRGVDTVVHLAAVPDEADFMEHLLEGNVVALYRIFSEAARAGVQRVIAASSIQVNTPWESGQERITTSDVPLLNNHYAMTKLWSEDMGALYARRFDLSVISVRIGWFPRSRANVEDNPIIDRLSNFYFSRGDTRRYFQRCVDSERPARGERVVLFALGRQQKPPFLDLTDAREIIGYEPQDTFPQNLEYD